MTPHTRYDVTRLVGGQLVRGQLVRGQLVRGQDTGRTPPANLGLYVHVPFCLARCQFCTLYMVRHSEDRVQQFLQALTRELHLYADDGGLRDVPVHTVYVGGGTPTTLTPVQLTMMLDAIRQSFTLDDDAEVSIEAHPGTVTPESLDALRRAGFVRLSMGGQSFDRRELVTLGGRVFGADIRQAARWAKAAGFVNVSLDLMFGFPGQSVASWQRTLDEAIDVSSTHLSCYAYTMEDGSPFHRQFVHGHGSEPDHDIQNAMEDIAAARLSAAGFARYEISNYCRPHYACRHNLRYWRGQTYLGLGPSAQSYCGGTRFGNVADLERYVALLDEGVPPLDDVAVLLPAQRDRERMVFGLRMLSGVAVPPAGVTGVDGETDAPTDLHHTIRRLQHDGLLIEEHKRLKLTPLGIRHADTVAVALL